ncbi:MAG: DDE-type integrase/transposase/recombinase [Chloroflexota bacterium]|nr:DDE-type integrase/transposase/recombinase [Chloroflexota bacterium]
MAYREVSCVEINEVIRRWQLGPSQRQIARGTGLSRPTVRRYLAAAVELGLSADGPEPDESQLARLAALSLAGPRRTDAPSEEQLTPWAEQTQVWLRAERLQITRIHELLGERGCQVSYNSLRRFIQRRGWRRRLVTMRLAESAPGEVAELDFGRLGLVPDPESERRRTVWALIVVLRYSRRCFVWPTTSQKLDAVLEGLEAAWAFFEGVPRHLVLDIFPAAVAGADRLHPRLTRGLPRVRPAARPDRRPDASAPAARQAQG